ncbi:MAG: hypothetical protein M0R70_12865 [Nitrospirae bacterium]|nr:hypothetical protein [Nitrospirota bacterium]
MRRSVITVLLLMIFSWSHLFAGDLPKFSITGQHKKSAISILVTQNNATPEKLKKLIEEFRLARQSNVLSKFIPPTTKGGSLGPYAIVDIYVFSDASWSTSERLTRFIKSNMTSPSDRNYSKKFIAKIKAYYHYSIPTNEEEGSLGYSEGTTMQSPHYKRLF